MANLESLRNETFIIRSYMIHPKISQQNWYVTPQSAQVMGCEELDRRVEKHEMFPLVNPRGVFACLCRG